MYLQSTFPKRVRLKSEVRDPNTGGFAGRIAKWRFSSAEVSDHLKKTPLGKGIHLQLPWPNASPQQEQLRLSVAYRTPDGRTLKAERPIKVRPPVTEVVLRDHIPALPEWSPTRR